MKTGEAIQYDGGNYDVIVVGAGHAWAQKQHWPLLVNGQ